MEFQPKTAAETSTAVFPRGEYDFEVVDAEDTVSKSSGNEMIKLRVRVFGPDGRTAVVTDYLLAAVAYKLRHAAEACGLIEQYEGGRLEAIDFEGKSGRLKLRIDVDPNGQFDDKNSVSDYVAGSAGSGRATRAPSESPPRKRVADLDDEIPF